MTAHSHQEHVPGCYRCELSEDEVRSHIAEFTVAHLDVKAGDVVLVKVPADYTPREQQQLLLSLDAWRIKEGLDLHFLVIREEWEVSVVHPAELDICGDTAPGFEGAMLVCSKPLGHTGSTHQSDNGAAWTDTAANT